MKNAVLLLVVALCSVAARSQKVYMKVEGAKQGIMKDDNAQPRVAAGWIELAGYSFEARGLRDAGGQAVGRQAGGQLDITKYYGKSSIQLFAACVENENLKTVTIEILSGGMGGEEKVEERVTFSNAVVTMFKQGYSSINMQPAQPVKERPYDEIKISYQRMVIEYPSAGLQAAAN